MADLTCRELLEYMTAKLENLGYCGQDVKEARAFLAQPEEAREAALVAALPDPNKLRLIADWFDRDDAAKGRLGPSLATLGGQPWNEVQRQLRREAGNIDAALADTSPAAAVLLAQGETLERQVKLFIKRVIQVTKPYHENRDAPEAAEILFDIYEDAVTLRAALASPTQGDVMGAMRAELLELVEGNDSTLADQIRDLILNLDDGTLAEDAASPTQGEKNG